MTDKRFLREVQNAGWNIEAVTENACIGRCPTLGCSMRALMTEGKQIPQRVVPGSPSLDIVVESWDQLKVILKDRREELGLSIREVEEVTGIADDHIAKMEPKNASRQPNVDTLKHWTGGIGYEVVLRPVALPPVTLAMIEETRPKYTDRRKRFALERQRDGRQVRPGLLIADRSGR